VAVYDDDVAPLVLTLRKASRWERITHDLVITSERRHLESPVSFLASTRISCCKPSMELWSGGRGKEKGRTMKLWKTSVEDVRTAHCFLVPAPRLESKGMRVVVSS
jgi:hypothetical protein